MKQSIIPSGFARITGALALAATLIASSGALAFNITGDAASHRFSNGEKTVLSFTQDGSLTVTGSGTIELLVVGGGGGGGALGKVADQSYKVAAGGGAGGLVHKASFAVSAGTYTVTVGAGGAIGANGGNSSVFSVTAYGGGYGAKGGENNNQPGGNGGSGGGSNTGWTTAAAAGSAIYGDSGNLGHDGSRHGSRMCPGAGGGAGSSPAKKVKRDSWNTVLDIDDASDGVAYGGDGLAFDITGSQVWYAGGGAAYSAGNMMRSMGGKGGGGHGNTPGVDGLGGGGGGGAKGGSGCVIMSFIPDEAPPANSADFSLSGGTVLATPHGVAHKFTSDGTLTVTGSGTVELLVVGGGGGGGALALFNNSANVAPGGGAGGLVYAASVPVTAGSYAITVGAGGAIGANGGNSSALGYVAFGGGSGVAKSWGCNGGSGGGSANGWENTYYEGCAAYPAWGNQGHDGSRHGGYYHCGGGGGAGGSPAWQVTGGASTVVALNPYDMANVVGPAYGGDGLAFDISGISTYYAGGGAAYRSGNTGIAIGGKGGGGNGNQAGTDGLGGGGGGGAKGGSGVVIVRYVPKAKAGLPYAEGGTMTHHNGYHIHSFTSNGTFTMPYSAICDVLVVGGGGGGGALGIPTDQESLYVGAGGGAGGFVYLTNIVLSAGTHTVTVGAGGAVGANGGASAIDADSTFTGGIVAFGGGFGAAGGPAVSGHGNKGGGGASGGGSTSGWETPVAGGSAIYGYAGNAGHDGSKGETRFSAGGGGGAGGSPAKKVKRDSWGGTTLDIDDASSDGPAYGGDGLACDITGVSTYYAGGGAAYSSWGVGTVPGGKGGGGNGNQAGTDGLGGGGGGGKAGGSGVVIIRFLSSSPTVITFR